MYKVQQPPHVGSLLTVLCANYGSRESVRIERIGTKKERKKEKELVGTKMALELTCVGEALCLVYVCCKNTLFLSLHSLEGMGPLASKC